MTNEIRVYSPTGDAIDALVTASDLRANGLPVWTDDTTPRTDKPVRFGYRWHVGDISGNGACWVRLNRSEMPTGWRMGYRA